ncbi:MAG: PFL family protein [Clostridiales bacterium]|nr:PFL family protein [Clostridiales bacterium]
MLQIDEIIETIKMIQEEHLDIRTVTMGINLLDCIDSSIDITCKNIYDSICSKAQNLVSAAEEIESRYGIPIINKRISVTPVSMLVGKADADECVKIAIALDKAANETGVNFIGGYSALVHKGYTRSETELVKSIPQALDNTERVCSSVNVATTKSGINMDAIRDMGFIIKEAAELSKASGGAYCARIVVFANAPEDNPFMAGAFHGTGEPDTVINVGVSGPGVVKRALEKVRGGDFSEVAETIKKTAFKVTRMGQLVAMEASQLLNVPFGIVDLSLAPTPAIGDSVAEILEEMGLEKCGAPGTTAALALLNDAVKKGGVMASSYVGGLSGAFIPVSEDEGMIRAVRAGALTIEKLEAMTCVCSVGLDMVVVPGDTEASTISATIADEAAIGVINNKTTAVRIIPAPGKKIGDTVDFGGLLGSGPVMGINQFSAKDFIERGGRIPAPIHSLRN